MNVDVNKTDTIPNYTDPCQYYFEQLIEIIDNVIEYNPNSDLVAIREFETLTNHYLQGYQTSSETDFLKNKLTDLFQEKSLTGFGYHFEVPPMNLNIAGWQAHDKGTRETSVAWNRTAPNLTGEIIHLTAMSSSIKTYLNFNTISKYRLKSTSSIDRILRDLSLSILLYKKHVGLLEYIIYQDEFDIKGIKTLLKSTKSIIKRKVEDLEHIKDSLQKAHKLVSGETNDNVLSS